MGGSSVPSFLSPRAHPYPLLKDLLETVWNTLCYFVVFVFHSKCTVLPSILAHRRERLGG